MKRRPVIIDVTDHAVIRWLEREALLDVTAIRRHLAGLAVDGAELRATAVRAGRVRLMLNDYFEREDGTAVVAIATAMPGRSPREFVRRRRDDFGDG